VAEHLIVVDDDARLRGRLAKYLQREGYRVSEADGGVELRRIMAEGPADLVILDLMMPGEDGLSLTRFLRETSNAGIIIATGKGETVDRIVGLELGADDYIAKPFELRELLARVKSVLRRLNAPEATAESSSAEVRFAGWRLDLERRELTGPDGAAVHLTTAEFNLLAAFIESPNRPLDRDRLLDAAGGRGWQPYDRSIDLHISHLRRKLGDDPKSPTLIKTVRGAGYMLATSVEH